MSGKTSNPARPTGILRRRAAGAAAAAALTAVLLGLVAHAASASGTYDLTGVWDTYGTGGGYSGTFTVTDIVLTTGKFSGTGDGTAFALRGTETGDKVVFTQSQGSYVSTDKATVTRVGGVLEMTGGTWHDTNGSGGTFTAKRTTASGPAPVLAQSVAAGPVHGTVLVRRPGATAFTRLTQASLIPVGSTVDATAGTVALTSAGPGGHTYTGDFHAGEFVLTEDHAGVTNLTLTGGVPCAAAAAGGHAATAPGHKRSLWGTAHGHFQTTGRYAAATELGTTWLTRDECTGTLVRVTKGAVRVTALRTHRHFTLRAPGQRLVGA